MLPHSAADVLLLQETRLHGDDAISRASNGAARFGWRATLSHAKRTAANASSAGCAVCVKKNIGMRPHPGDVVIDGAQCRFHAAWVGGFLRGGLHCCSIYLKDSEGASETNLGLLQEVAMFLSCLRGPWIVGGDWNMTPETLSSTRFASAVRGIIIAPESPTCNQSVYDYFLISEGLLPCVAGVSRVDDAGLNPHWPARLYLRTGARRHLVRQLVRPLKVPAVIPHGPVGPGLDYTDARPTSVSQQVVNDCMAAWYAKARREWAHLCCQDDRDRAHRFKWAPAVGAIAAPSCGFSKQATFWRSLARRFQEVCALLSRLNSTSCSLIVRHVVKAWDAFAALSDPSHATTPTRA